MLTRALPYSLNHEKYYNRFALGMAIAGGLLPTTDFDVDPLLFEDYLKDVCLRCWRKRSLNERPTMDKLTQELDLRVAACALPLYILDAKDD